MVVIPGGPFHVAAVQVLLLLPRALVKYGAIEGSLSPLFIKPRSGWSTLLVVRWLSFKF